MMGKQTWPPYFALVLLICCLQLSMAIDTNTDNMTDLSALLAFKAQNNFHPFIAKNWSTATSFCNWFGVSCSSNKERVVGLDLYSMHLNGTIPSQVGNLSFLVYMDLSNNSFHGPLPKELGNLRNLRYINLSNNSFYGDIPSELTMLPLLQDMILANNSFTGISSKPSLMGRSSIFNMTSIETLNLEGNLLQRSILDEIGNLTSLKELSMGYNQLNGAIPSILFDMNSLEFLDLPNNNFLGNLQENLCNQSTKLRWLNLGGNKLYGQIPFDLYKCKELQVLRLISNEFTGSIPTQIGNFTKLKQLNIGRNYLTGEIPSAIGRLVELQGLFLHEIENLKVVVLIDISENELSGQIPTTIGGMQDLIALYLHGNKLQGQIPESIDNLIGLEFLDLSRNNLSGMIPKSLEKLLHLKYFNVSFNQLQGEIPDKGPFMNFSFQFFIGNKGLCGLPRKAKLKDPESFLQLEKWRRISYRELEFATNGFQESNFLGVGSFGKVYKGTLSDGTIIAIKVFNMQLEKGFKSFEKECDVLRNLRHRNLVKVVSSCCNLDFKALVIEFMPNGSLEKWLYSENYFLDILQRLNIMVDVASALEYIHHGCVMPVVHCDIKPSNVLLNEEKVGFVADFGIAKLLGEEDSVKQTITLATIGYMAPEYGSEGLVSMKCDVYSYGILLMETFTRKKPTDELFSEEMSLKQWVEQSLSYDITQALDANLISEEEEEQHFVAKMDCITSILKLALQCSTILPQERLDMKDVVVALKKIKKKFLEDIEP
ncbi:hypothetical protein JCGZ_01906 [Jatropha curcas]|uniref:non-specific serine/threonine protein kinase n=1 Tax=Jatropha curcas TaxID=180498 RepID=A0A067L4G1_JATCU|nr:hypothetical protein JCGZ_01906 [Jatropha curcas]